MREVEVIEKPFHYWRGKWRQGDFALVTGDIAVVFYDRGNKSRRMKASGVFTSEKMLKAYQRKYREGWIAAAPCWRHSEYLVVAVRLEFVEDYYRGCHFRFAPQNEDDAPPHEHWVADWVLNTEGDTRFFTTERAALRYAEKLQRRRVRDLQEKVKKPEAVLAGFKKRIASLRKGAA